MNSNTPTTPDSKVGFGPDPSKIAGMKWHWPIPSYQRVRGSFTSVALVGAWISAFVADMAAARVFYLCKAENDGYYISRGMFWLRWRECAWNSARSPIVWSAPEIFLAHAYLLLKVFFMTREDSFFSFFFSPFFLIISTQDFFLFLFSVSMENLPLTLFFYSIACQLYSWKFPIYIFICGSKAEINSILST